MRYTINYYDKAPEFVNTDDRYSKRQTIVSTNKRSTIDQRQHKTRRANLPRFKSIVYAGLIFAVIAYVAPRIRHNTPETTPEQPQQAQAIAEPPSSTPEPAKTDLYDKYFKEDAPIARAICKAENRAQDASKISKPNHDGSRDYGLCQINDKWQADKYTNTSELLDAENNIRIAKQIHDEWGNWNAWTTYRSGAYKQFIE